MGVCDSAHNEYPNMKGYEFLRTMLQADNHREEHKMLCLFFWAIVPRGVYSELQTKPSKDGQGLNMSSKD